MSYSFLLKCIIIGDSGVGKSCLLLQFTDKRFRQKHDVTIGVEFGAKTIRFNQNNIKLQIWDTAGQESFKSITRGYYRNAIGAVVCYDITSRESFDHISKWIQQAKSNSPKNLYFILAANKSDREQQRVISFQEGVRLANQYNIPFVETSAKVGTNIADIFNVLTKEILKNIQKGNIDYSNHPGIKLGTQKYNNLIQAPEESEKIDLNKNPKKNNKQKPCCK